MRAEQVDDMLLVEAGAALQRRLEFHQDRRVRRSAEQRAHSAQDGQLVALRVCQRARAHREIEGWSLGPGGGELADMGSARARAHRS